MFYLSKKFGIIGASAAYLSTVFVNNTTKLIYFMAQTEHTFNSNINVEERNKLFNEKNLIFIISPPRSGSTLLQRILNNSSEIETTSEPWFLLHYLGIKKIFLFQSFPFLP